MIKNGRGNSVTVWMQITGLFFLFCGSSNLSLNFFSFVNDILAEISSRNIYNGMKIWKEWKPMAGLRKWLDMLSVRMRIFGIFGVTMHANG